MRNLSIRNKIITAFSTLVIVVGAIYYLVAQRGREDAVAPDVATGEAVIA